MNPIFMISLLIIMIITLLFDLRKLRNQKKTLRIFYFAMFAVSSALYLAVLLRLPIPMPTSFFIHKVSPWVFSLIEH